MSSILSREYHLSKFDGIHDLAISEVPLPQIRGTEVLVKIHAVSLNFRDLNVITGTYPLPVKANVIPTSDSAGKIVALGADVLASKKWAIGDRVCANFALDHLHGDTSAAIQGTSLGAPVDGVLAEYKAFPAHALVKIPDQLSYEEASTLPCAALTAYNALLGPVPLKGGDTVLVQGTGGVSIFALQIAVASGATVIATSSSDAKLQVAKSLGAHHLINYKKTPDWHNEVLRITNGVGVDHVVEVGGSGTMAKTVQAVRYDGWVHAIGYVAEGGDEVNIAMSAIVKAFTLRGIQIGSVAQFEDLMKLVTAADIRPVIDKVFDFEDAGKAYEHLQSQAHVGKVVIKVSRD
ncbi:hypothetical protein PLICRDRAFT_56210 [Plicaturopsis crispa FD-325 SS-3]|nr:hypothetical protein PLICRDRAFT_56210 [Plicaturopsis crispa FD-325 SS-3]